jgi:heterodisulfide reductase subunit A-like polyferredoxin
MKKPKYIPPFMDIPAERQKMPELPLEDRTGNFNEVDLGFTEEMALREAARCLSCRRCIGCGLCLAECDQEAVIYDETAKDLTLEADGVVFTSDGVVYDPAGEPELGYASSADVITSLEFERLASPTGPFGGYILRPFDGEQPRRIAFVQCVGSREESIGANFCSVVCCSRTLSQAKAAKDHVGDVKVTVFHRGLRPIGKRSEIDLAELEAADWVQFIEARIAGIKEDVDTGTVTITYSAGEKIAEAEFDLVVLAVGVHSSAEFRRHARTAGLKTNKYGFVGLGLADLVNPFQGVAFAGAITGPVADTTAVAQAVAAAGRSLASVAQPEAVEHREGAGEPSVFACEYGLTLAGRTGDIDDLLDAQGLTLDGSYAFLCYKEGRRAMAEKVGRTGRLVVLGCHRGSHESLFERVLDLPRSRITIVGIDEIGQGLAGSVKARADASLAGAAKSTPRVSTVAIIGSGTSGLAAAAELLRRGLGVVLIEKSDKIGGPFLGAFGDSGGGLDTAEAFMKSIETNPNARVIASSTVTSLERTDGKLVLEVSGQGGKETVEAGAVLVATGAGRYRPGAGLYGTHDLVIDQWELAARIADGKTDKKHVVMIQCVGARDEEHPYCSRYCCKQAITNASLYKTANPEADVTILHKGIRVFGLEEDLFTDAMEKGVRFVKVMAAPETQEGTGLKVTAVAEGGERIALDADLVVLSLAHMHGQGHKDLSEVLGTELDDLGFFASGDSLLDPFSTTADKVFVCGFARCPVVAEEAYIEGIGAAQAVCAGLMR